MSIPGSASPLFLASTAAAGAYDIPRSLRFNSGDSAYLNRTPSSAGNRKTWTWSGWVKRSKLGAYQVLWSAGPGSYANLYLLPGDGLYLEQYTSSTDYRAQTAAVFRDASAWYHVVLAFDSTQSTSTDRIKIYINGQVQTITGSPIYPSQDYASGLFNSTDAHSIGRNQPGGSMYLDGYLADIHLIDGQALAPSDFGEYDDNNVWQPIEYAGTYGTNGFKLNFSDTSSDSALGTDSSGEGNDWSVNNLSVGTPNARPYASQFVSSNGFNASYPAIKAFDDSTSTYAQASTSGGTLTFTPSTGISYSSSIKIWMPSAGATASINGGSPVSVANSSETTIATGSGTLTSLVLAASNIPGLAYIKIDDQILVNSGFDADNDALRDTPVNGNSANDTGAGGEITGNYATLNPLLGAQTLSNGNLDVTGGSSWQRSVSTIAMSSGKWYWEYEITASNEHFVGVGPLDMQMGGNLGAGSPPGSGYGTELGQVNGTGANGSWSNTGGSTTGDLIGVAFDADAGNMYIYKNGTALNSGTASHTGLTNGPYYAVFSLNGSSRSGSVNFGQRSWAYAAPSNYKALCTANLPDPTIADGSTAFDTKLWSGNTSVSTDITGYNFSPDFVWIKNRNSTEFHIAFDTIRGAAQYIYPNLTNGENDGGSNTLTAFNSDGFTLYDPGGWAVNGTGKTYVGWAWDAGENSNKTYAVTVSNPGSGNKFYVDGAQQPTLTLAEGSTYKFDQSSSTNSTHPLRFSTTSDGTHGGGTEYTTGVTTVGTPGSAGAYTQIVIAASAPTLYAYCSNHSGMGFQVNTSDTAGYTIPVGGNNSAVYNQSAVWSGMCSPAPSIGTYVQGFDGNLTSVFASGISAGSYFTFTPTGGLTFSNSVRVYMGGVSGASYQYNGGTTGSLPINSWTTVVTGGGTMTSLGVTRNVLDVHGWFAIEVDGKLLVDQGLSVSSVPSISSRIQADPSKGFSIVSYTGNDTAGATVGHGLSAAPEFIIFKNRDNAYNWSVLHTSLNIAGGEAINLNQSNAKYTSIAQFNNTLPTSTVFTLGTGGNTNYQSGDDFIAYCFAPVEGYSAFGSYTGNGSATDGPFVYTGFRPRWLMVKSSSNSGEHWLILDTARDTYNLADATIYANLSNAEFEASGLGIDILSNGFKPRGTNAGTNASGYTYIYIAFASHPFKTARAR